MAGEDLQFRESAVESAASPDQVNKVAPIASPRLWLLVLAASLVLAAFGSWAVLGSIPLTVRGTGILIEGTMVVAAESSDLDRDYEGPDGERITFGDERFRTPEALFQPALLGRSGVGVHRCTYDSIMKCDPGIRQQMFDSIVLAGGNTLFPGL